MAFDNVQRNALLYAVRHLIKEGDKQELQKIIGDLPPRTDKGEKAPQSATIILDELELLLQCRPIGRRFTTPKAGPFLIQAKFTDRVKITSEHPTKHFDFEFFKDKDHWRQSGFPSGFHGVAWTEKQKTEVLAELLAAIPLYEQHFPNDFLQAQVEHWRREQGVELTRIDTLRNGWNQIEKDIRDRIGKMDEEIQRLKKEITKST